MIDARDPMMTLDTEEQQERIAERNAALLREQILADTAFSTVANTPEGRRFLRRVLAECGIYQSSFAKGEGDVTAYREGKRSIGLWLLSLFDDIPETYIQLLTDK